MAILHSDVTNVDLLYDKKNGYEYSLPRNILESFLSGKAFDNKEEYTEEELQQLFQDITDLFNKITSRKPLKEKIAVITAGAPGCGKTILMERDLKGKNIAYVDPDAVCIKELEIYKSDIEKNGLKAAYNKSRPASNGAAHLILAHLVREHYAFYFGTTSSSPATGKFFDFLKKRGYKIRLIHLSAPNQVRWDSIKERDKIFVQTTEQDVIEKGKLVPQRILDTYLKYADEIEFYYREKVDQEAILAAKWNKDENHPENLQKIQIIDPTAYEKIASIHNAIAATLNQPDLFWERIFKPK